ncbi:MAG TPA: hypothetical protein VK447_09810, partial [Myxococcaceae bacterium]|nr:hypothetical protein [Myxococcaceae bacterium]
RFPLLKEWLVSQIHAAVRTPASLRAIEDAATFIQFDWQWSHLPEDIARSRGPHPDERLQEGYSRLEENLKPSAFAEQFAYQALLALAQALRQQDAGRAPTDQERDERLLEWLGKFRAEYKGTQAAEITTVLAEAEANHRLGRYAQAANGYQTFLEAAAKVSQDLWRITPEQWGFIREAKGEVEGKDGFQGELLERAKRGRVTYHEVCAERLRGREREEAELLRGLVASQVKALREWWPSSMTAPPAGGAEPPAR